MSKFQDLTGQRFGRLVVTHHAGRFSGMTKWHCVCDCGKELDVFRPSLVSGKTVSCGCYRKERVTKSLLIDLTGMKFGKWTVLYRADTRTTTKGGKVTLWKCSCSCGTERDVSSLTLLRGQSKSCGCDLSRKNRTQDISNLKFGTLNPIKVVGRSSNRGNIWKCKCDCGNIVNVLSRSLKSGRTTSCGCRGKESSIAIQVKRYFKDTHSAKLEYKVIKNPETGRWLSYDIFLPDKVFIEINGEQHYKYVPYFFKNKERFEGRIRADKLKRKYAKENGKYIEVDLRKIKTTQDVIQYIESNIAP